MQGCKDEHLVIPKIFQESKAIVWYHHYLQHPSHTRLRQTLNQAMYWTTMCHICPATASSVNLAK
jgi:hypothetical protein